MGNLDGGAQAALGEFGWPGRRRTRVPAPASWLRGWGRSSILPVAAGEVFGGDVAADRAAVAGVAGAWWSERDREHSASYLGDHEPMSWRLGGVKQRLACPDICDVLETQAGVLEQMAGLLVDLEGPAGIEVINVEPVHTSEAYSRRLRAATLPSRLTVGLGEHQRQWPWGVREINGAR